MLPDDAYAAVIRRQGLDPAKWDRDVMVQLLQRNFVNVCLLSALFIGVVGAATFATWSLRSTDQTLDAAAAAAAKHAASAVAAGDRGDAEQDVEAESLLSRGDAE